MVVFWIWVVGFFLFAAFLFLYCKDGCYWSPARFMLAILFLSLTWPVWIIPTAWMIWKSKKGRSG